MLRTQALAVPAVQLCASNVRRVQPARLVHPGRALNLGAQDSMLSPLCDVLGHLLGFSVSPVLPLALILSAATAGQAVRSTSAATEAGPARHQVCGSASCRPARPVSLSGPWSAAMMHAPV